MKINEDETPEQIPPSASKFLPGLKPLSAIATSSNDSATAVLAALAIIADSIETNTETNLKLRDLPIGLSTAGKSPIH